MNQSTENPLDRSHAARRQLSDRFGWSDRVSDKPAFDAAMADMLEKSFGDQPSCSTSSADPMSEQELSFLADRLSIPESYFFRDQELFAILEQEILRNRAIADHKAIRIWSAGCARGEEAYTIATVAAATGLSERVSVIATDLSPANISTAIKGVYKDWSVRDDVPLARGVVTKNAGRYRVPRGLQSMVDFRTMNLLDVDRNLIPKQSVDVVFCRNVLIYLTPAAVAAVAQVIYDSLAPGGYCFVAPSDPELVGLVPLERVRLGGRTVLRRPTAQPSISACPQRVDPKRTESRAPSRPWRVPLPKPPISRGEPGTNAEIATAAQPTKSPAPSREATELIDDGVELLETGDAAAAVGAFRAATCVDPRSIFAYRMLAVAYLSTGEKRRARSAARIAVKLLSDTEGTARAGSGEDYAVRGFGSLSNSEILADLVSVSTAAGAQNDSP